MKGATAWDNSPCQTLYNFNPRTREGCDLFPDIYRVFIFISIHAPVKGATSDGKGGYAVSGISIHAPVKGATKTWRAECLKLIISIHAPVKGATNVTEKISE
ncbi:hypothetical protein FSA31_1574 [Streptococcus mutans]|nr:hypothetical protein FSA31_1574 [Streptococcus mutans]